MPNEKTSGFVGPSHPTPRVSGPTVGPNVSKPFQAGADSKPDEALGPCSVGPTISAPKVWNTAR